MRLKKRSFERRYWGDMQINRFLTIDAPTRRFTNSIFTFEIYTAPVVILEHIISAVTVAWRSIVNSSERNQDHLMIHCRRHSRFHTLFKIRKNFFRLRRLEKEKFSLTQGHWWRHLRSKRRGKNLSRGHPPAFVCLQRREWHLWHPGPNERHGRTRDTAELF